MKIFFKSLFSRAFFKNEALPLPSTPENMRIYAIGDIHGRYDLLEKLHYLMVEDIERNQDNLENRVVFLGDYIDRGPESKAVIDAMIQFKKTGLYNFLKGNHEITLLNFLDDPQILGNWRTYGGRELLLSYGVNLDHIQNGFQGVQDEFAKQLPDSHLHFYQSLQTSVTLGDYFFVHAGIRPGIALEQQTEKDMLWIRKEFLESKLGHDKFIIHGHTPVSEPEILHNRINIDTGSYMSDKLTCLVLEGTDKRFLQVTTKV